MPNRSSRQSGDADLPLQLNADCPDQPSTQDAHELARLSHGMLMKLNRTIEGEIVPRLLMAFDSDAKLIAENEVIDTPAQTDIDEFVRLLLTHDAQIAARYVAEVRSSGVSLPTIYLELLAPAARRLGEMWEDDDCSFTDVTLGVCRMHQVLIEFSRCFEPTDNSSDEARNALLVPAPGEQHTFGLFMVIEFLRRAGWHCWTGTPASSTELTELVADQHFELIGLSVSAEDALDGLEAEVSRIRRSSRNPDALIMLGGWMFMERPELALEFGADASAANGEEAVAVVEQLCPAPRPRAN